MPQTATQTLALEVLPRMPQTATKTLALTVNPATPSLLLPSCVAAAKSKASSNTTQWQAFKNRLDNGDTTFGGLAAVIDGTYEGSGNLPLASDYALGALTLATLDPVTAKKYADKATALLNSLCNDNQISYATWTVAWQLIAITDGVAKTFTLPQTPNPASTLSVRMTTAYNIACTHTTNGIDTITPQSSNSLVIYKVSNSSGLSASADYTRGTDWQQIGNTPSGSASPYTNYVDWSLASAHQPASGATYYVTCGDAYELPGGAVSSQPTLVGNQITFTVPPAAGKALWAKFLYTDSAGRQYQQSSQGTGGYQNAFIDSGFVLRYLNKHGALAYNWLVAGGFTIPAALDARFRSLAVRWFNYTTPPGDANGLARYARFTESNYSAGYYVGNVLAALALQYAGDANGSSMVSIITTFRNNYVRRSLAGTGQPAGTVSDAGYWSEGYSYGDGSTISHVIAALAGEQGGLWTATEERSALAAAITSLNHSRYQRFSYLVNSSHGVAENYHRYGYVAPLGDTLDYPFPWPSAEFTYALSAFLTGNPQTWAQWENANSPSESQHDMLDVLFHDPTQTGTDPATQLPLDYYEVPSGFVASRSDWSYASSSVWISYICGDILQADHQTWAAGSLMINRGSDDLIINAMQAAAWENFPTRSRYGSLPVLAAPGQSTQEVQGGFYGYYYHYTATADSATHPATPKVTNHEANPTAGYAFVQSNINPAYSSGASPGAGNVASECTRDWLYLRAAGYLVCYDRVTLLSASNSEKIRWWTHASPTIAGNAWNATQGSSKIFGITYSNATITTTATSETLSGNLGGTFWRTDVTRSAYNTSPVRYVTALQMTASTTGSMDASAHVVSGDGQLEGVLLGTSIVLFVSTAPWSASSTYSFTAGNGQTVTHYVTGLPANRSCTLTGANQASAITSASGVLTFTTAGTGSAQSVTLS